jgi:hypothetical protein
MKLFKAAFLRGVLVCALLCSASPSNAALLRGRIQRSLPTGVIGLQGFAVTVYSQYYGRSQPTYSDGNGMYSLQLPPGQYTLEVWLPNNPNPLVFPIYVNEPNTDLVPINL